MACPLRLFEVQYTVAENMEILHEVWSGSDLVINNSLRSLHVCTVRAFAALPRGTVSKEVNFPRVALQGHFYGSCPHRQSGYSCRFGWENTKCLWK